jgi:hypothetical protein
MLKTLLIIKIWWEKNWNDDNLWYASTFENIHNLNIVVLEILKNSKYNFRMFNFEESFANVTGDNMYDIWTKLWFMIQKLKLKVVIIF